MQRKTVKSGEEQRQKGRGRIIGDILWSYATQQPAPQYEGSLIDLSNAGVGMLSERPVREASVLRILAKGIWAGEKYATVMWCENVAQGVFRCGLLFTE